MASGLLARFGFRGETVLREQTFRHPKSLEPDWTLRIALGQEEFVSVEGAAGAESLELDLTAFSALVASSFRARSGGWRAPTLS